mgnify:CR=1 FL=1
MSVALQGSLWRPGLPPGIYEEKPAVATRPLVRLDVAALIGLAERGPVNTPVAIDDARQFEALFGRALPGLNLPLAVRLFFANGGRRVTPYLIDYVQDRDGETIFRADYRAPSHLIDTVHLEFDLDADSTSVINTMHVRPNPDAQHSSDLILNGETLTLVSVAVDVSPSASLTT